MAIVKKPAGLAAKGSPKTSEPLSKKEEVGSVSYVEVESTVVDPDGVVLVSETERKSLRVAVLPQGVTPATVSVSLEEKRPTVPYGNVNGRVSITVPCVPQEVAEVYGQVKDLSVAALKELMEELAGDFPIDAQGTSAEDDDAEEGTDVEEDEDAGPAEESVEDLLAQAEAASREELEELVASFGMTDERGKPLKNKDTEKLRADVIDWLEAAQPSEEAEGGEEDDAEEAEAGGYSEAELQGKTVEELTEILQEEFDLPVVAKKCLPKEGVHVPKTYTPKQRKAALVSAILAEQAGDDEDA
jgi:hypothetical protein